MPSDPPRSTRRTVIKSMALGAAACVLGDLTAGATPSAAQATRRRKLPRATPEELGIASDGIAAFVEAVEQKVGGLHSFMLLRHGQVAAEAWWSPYAPGIPHMLFSLSKSFTSSAVGLAISEGLFTVDSPVISFFPDSLPAKVSDNLAAMRVRHLLSMSTGHDRDATGPMTSAPDGDWVKAFLALPVEHTPGAPFVYNSAATYMLSAIVQKRTGMRVRDYLEPRLFTPLGIEGTTWETCPKGINAGGWGLNVKTEDIARFGQLYLQKGRWNSRQLLPAHWVEEATSKQVSNGDPATGSDWNQGYGYQFWRCRHGIYRGDGAFGQYCIVMPEQDAVLAITSGVGDMQAVLTIVWEHLLPAMQPDPLPVSDTADAFRRRLAGLTVPSPKGRAASPTARRVTGKTYRFTANDEKLESASLAFEGNRCRMTLRAASGETRIDCGLRSWVKGTAPLGDSTDSKVAARGAWTDENTFTLALCFYETPFLQTVACRFNGDEVTVSRRMNVGFGPTELPALTGRAA